MWCRSCVMPTKDPVKLSAAATAMIHKVLTRFVTNRGNATAAIAIGSGPSSASRPIGIAASTSKAALASTTHWSIDRTRGCCARRPK